MLMLCGIYLTLEDHQSHPITSNLEKVICLRTQNINQLVMVTKQKFTAQGLVTFLLQFFVFHLTTWHGDPVFMLLLWLPIYMEIQFTLRMEMEQLF